MSLTTNIKNLFAKPESKNILGISLRQNSLAYYCINSEGENLHNQIELSPPEYEIVLSSLHKKTKLTGQCHLVLAPGQNQMVQIDKPNVPEVEVLEALKWQIKDLVSYPPEDMTLDYFDGPILSGGVAKINVVCASKEELTKLVKPLTKDDLSLKTITTEEFAFAALVESKEDACLMVCQQPNEEIVLLIVKQGQLYFTRRLRGFAQIADKSEDELAFGIIDNLSLEIQRSTDYFERQLKQAPIRSIEVIVPIKNEAFLARKLAEYTNVAVNILPLPNGLDDYRDFAVAVGATQLNHMEPSE
jgi:MSHA biogenesis protein MshI